MHVHAGAPRSLHDGYGPTCELLDATAAVRPVKHVVASRGRCHRKAFDTSLDFTGADSGGAVINERARMARNLRRSPTALTPTLAPTVLAPSPVSALGPRPLTDHWPLSGRAQLDLPSRSHTLRPTTTRMAHPRKATTRCSPTPLRIPHRLCLRTCQKLKGGRWILSIPTQKKKQERAPRLCVSDGPNERALCGEFLFILRTFEDRGKLAD
ncbi:hypothetical protein B0H19DRAFT_1256352 [Mycena capillaripes]|nr:hypothetical protein B0H19DRAFT_1256352 [Mycena capillaripes]